MGSCGGCNWKMEIQTRENYVDGANVSFQALLLIAYRQRLETGVIWNCVLH